MKNKVALVTGGTTGIGRATALAFAKKGARVAICGRRQAEGEKTIALINEVGGEGFFMSVDVTDEATVEQFVQATVARYGQLDYAFNNAGISGKPGLLADIMSDDWRDVVEINLFGTWLCMKYELQQMLKQQSGVIVNMASVAGVGGTPGIGPYTAAKHGIIGLAKTAALEYATEGIRVNVVAPGGINTEILQNVLPTPEIAQKFREAHPMQRLGTPEEVAHTVLWLCSEEAGFITGNVVMIDGGISAGTNPFA